jgi:hypothetical protein
MILVLLALAVENLLGNKFYRQPSQEEVGVVKVPEAPAAEKQEPVSAS